MRNIFRTEATMSVERMSSLHFILVIYILSLQRSAEDIRSSKSCKSALGPVSIWVSLPADSSRLPPLRASTETSHTFFFCYTTVIWESRAGRGGTNRPCVNCSPGSVNPTNSSWNKSWKRRSFSKILIKTWLAEKLSLFPRWDMHLHSRESNCECLARALWCFI